MVLEQEVKNTLSSNPFASPHCFHHTRDPCRRLVSHEKIWALCGHCALHASVLFAHFPLFSAGLSAQADGQLLVKSLLRGGQLSRKVQPLDRLVSVQSQNVEQLPLSQVPLLLFSLFFSCLVSLAGVCNAQQAAESTGTHSGCWGGGKRYFSRICSQRFVGKIQSAFCHHCHTHQLRAPGCAGRHLVQW